MRRPKRSVECSDSEKNMSAFADQNHAPSLTCVRLELKKSGVVVREYPQNSVCGMGLFRLLGAMVLPLCEICQKSPIIYIKIVKCVVHSNEKYVIILISNLIFR